MADESQYGDAYARCPYPVRLWQLGMWEAYSGRTRVADSISKILASRAKTSGATNDLLLSRSMSAHAALARGDSAGALRMLTALVATELRDDDLPWNVVLSRGTDRLALAELLLSQGHSKRAIDVASVFDSAWPQIYILYYPASLKLRANAASALGDNEAAARYRNKLTALHGGQAVAVR